MLLFCAKGKVGQRFMNSSADSFLKSGLGKEPDRSILLPKELGKKSLQREPYKLPLPYPPIPLPSCLPVPPNSPAASVLFLISRLSQAAIDTF